jgi:hypothetical protein
MVFNFGLIFIWIMSVARSGRIKNVDTRQQTLEITGMLLAIGLLINFRLP